MYHSMILKLAWNDARRPDKFSQKNRISLSVVNPFGGGPTNCVRHIALPLPPFFATQPSIVDHGGRSRPQIQQHGVGEGSPEDHPQSYS